MTLSIAIVLGVVVAGIYVLLRAIHGLQAVCHALLESQMQLIKALRGTATANGQPTHESRESG